ncbi:hypothetical protein OG500_13625 [Kitasatospora sp. NBC_01250]|uniref:hypothetical protein n=1 Tax=unclassified Kitasatospora TaxID=2633591 RepID=UPI002E0D6FD0|nr:MULTISPECIES: hypothetical protein [unclassified Kitasatospora]WSJ67301.1 hypothetical protein OG294_14900 [Kitasatospora sp. NBC_01302]
MPVFPEEPEIHESIPGPGVPFPRESDAQALSTPAAGSASPVSPTVEAPAAARPTPASVQVPGPRPGPPRPAAPRPGPRAAQIPKPGPRPTPAGPTVQLVPSAVGAALERADEAVDLLLESGREPGDILVLTSDGPHPWQQHEMSFGEDHYWAQLAEGGDVFYADLALTRPARREVVVLVLGASEPGRAVLALEKARTHAASLLVVCGTTAQLTEGSAVGGQPVPA